MEIPMKVTKNVKAKELRIHMKVRDQFEADVFDEDGTKLGGCGESGGYVPDFMPGDHYGDYLILNIHIDTGVIMNWRKPTPEQLVEFISGSGESDDE